MEQSRITLDAHTLIWYFHTESNIKLSQRALTVIMEAEESGIIYVPSVAMLEILRLIEKGKFPLSYDDLLFHIEQSIAYNLISLDNELLKTVPDVTDRLELHDRVIVATAIFTDTSLVSKDIKISKVYDRVIW